MSRSRDYLRGAYNFYPQVEPLEDRLALAVVFSGGNITCTGSDNSDSFVATLDENGTDILVNGGRVFDAGNPATLGNTGLILMFGNGGDDFLSVQQDLSIEAHLFGGDGNDTLTGGHGNDILDGGANTAGGRDLVIQSGDVDFILSNGSLVGLGADTVSGIEEAQLTGGDNANTLDASNFTAGPVTLLGLDGDDTLRGGGAGDLLSGGDGDDRLFGNGGNDDLFGGNDNDELHGGSGNDHLFGDDGNDKLFGDEDGDPNNVSGAINDELTGGSGDDELHGNVGDDRLNGGEDNDQLFGDLGRDQLAGEEGDDELHGGDEFDSLLGGDGDDQLFGEGGDDLLQGNAGNDTLDGGAGNFDGVSVGNFGVTTDQLFNLTGTQVFSDSDGTDTIAGGIEQLNLNGGAGVDTFIIDGFLSRINVSGGDGEDILDFRLDFPQIAPVGTNTSGLPRVNFTDPATSRTGSVVSSGRFIERFQFHLGAGNNAVDLSQWSGIIEELDGGNGSNTIAVTKDGDITAVDGRISALAAGVLSAVDFTNFGIVALTGGPGSNRLDASAFSGTAFLAGLAGDDTLLGTQGDDLALLGGDGDDTIEGNNGNDLASGGAGDDTINGGEGNDQLFGDAGDDFLDGSLGDDTLEGNAGDDELLGGQDDDTLKGGDGNDTLEGSTGNDVLAGGAGKNKLDGGIGDDTILGEGNFNFILTAKKLTGPGQDTFVDIERADLRGGTASNVFTFDNFLGKGTSTVHGMGGDHDRVVVKLKVGDIAVFSTQSVQVAWGADENNLTGLNFSNGASPTVQGLSLFGGSAGNKFRFADIDSQFLPDGLSVDGGGGKDTFQYDGSAIEGAVYTLALDKLTVSKRAKPIALSKIEILDVTGGAGDDVFDVSAWTKEAQIDGGAPVFPSDGDVLRSTNDKNFTLTETVLTRSDKARIQYSSMERVELTGGGKKNTLTVNATLGGPTEFPFPVVFTGGGGEDQLVLNLKAGGDGTTTSLQTGDSAVNFSLSAGGSSGQVRLADVEKITLNGDAGPDVFNVDSNFPGKVAINGGSDDEDRFELKLKESANVVAATKKVSLSSGAEIALNAIEDLIVSAAAGLTSRVDVSAWNLAGEIIGTGADVTLVATNNLPGIRLAEDKLIRSGKEILLANVLAAEITGGSGKNVINATGFTRKATLKGLGGDDALTGGDGDDVLDGGKGKDTLDGGPGVDTILNPDPKDTQVNIP